MSEAETAANNRRVFLCGAVLAGVLPAAFDVRAQPAASRPTPAAVRPITVYDLRELEARAEAVLAKGPFEYVAGAAGDGWTKAENEAALKRITLAPQYLTGVTAVDMSTTLAGARIAAPIIVPPMGGQGMVHTSAEVGTAEGAAAEGLLMTSSTYSSLSMEAIASATRGPKWFHVYIPQDRGVARDLLARAKAAGYLAMVVTIDTAAPGNRTLNALNNFPPPDLPLGNFPDRSRSAQKRGIGWDDIEFVQKATDLPVIIKGVLGADLTAQALRNGLAGVQVSNHGGRALDDTPATITVLPRIVDAADGRMTIVVDGGFRRGQDVFKALAVGADAVGVGRPLLYGLALGGWMGVQASIARLKAELDMTMRLMGTRAVADIGRNHLYAG